MFVSPVFALEISTDYDSNVIVRDFDNSVDFTLKISNATDGVYNLYSLADVFIEPRAVFTISGGEIEKDFTVKAANSLDVEGYYTFTYTLNHRDVEKFDEKFSINLLGLEDVLDISSDSIDPNLNVVKFYVENKENIYLENLSATFSSILFDVEKTFSLEPFEKIEFSVEVEEDLLKETKAGVYIIESVFETDKGSLKIDGNLYLGEKKGIATSENVGGFLIRTQTITKINVGNVLEKVEVKVQRNIFSRLFTSFNIEPIIIDREGFKVEYTWIKERLDPTEEFTIKAKTSYVIPFFVLVLIAFSLMGYQRFVKTKIEVRKSVTPVKTKNGEFALRIKLSLMARKSVENVSLVDKVPAIVKIYKKFGMLKPDKIDAESRRIHWHVGDLNAGEERVFTYVVYSKVGIVGKFVLPSALAVFEKEDQIHEVESNKVFFMNEQV